jgi:SAM-dependent methyltransferase
MPTSYDTAQLYDLLNGWGPSDDFYLDLVMAADSVLDVGCGTGVLLRRARESGHTGRLLGFDPDPVMLERARRRSDIEWEQIAAAAAVWQQEFDLAVMASHAFQFLVSDEELAASLAAIHATLVGGGRFAFETRNPLVREWERWNPSNPFDLVDPDGVPIRVSYQVEVKSADIIACTETTSSSHWSEPIVERADMRFLDAATLATFLVEAGFEIEHQYGDWDRTPLTPDSSEIITVARR